MEYKSAVHNIKNLVTKLNLDLKVNVVDWEEMRDFQLAYFKSGMSNLDTPQDQALWLLSIIMLIKTI